MRLRRRVGHLLVIALLIGLLAAVPQPASASTAAAPVRIPVRLTDSVTESLPVDADGVLTALILGGTFMPRPSARWLDAVIADYINPATGDSYSPVTVEYPATLASYSFPDGFANLSNAMAQQLANHPDDPFLIAGYSQGSAIVTLMKLQLMEMEAAERPDVTFLLLGSGDRPNGGIFSRFSDEVPTFNPDSIGYFLGTQPTDGGIRTIDIAHQYELTSDLPRYPLNLVATLNAFLGLIYSHAAYANGPLPFEFPAVWPESMPLAGPFADEYILGSMDIVKQTTGDTDFYFIPVDMLPLLGPLRTLGVPDSLLNIVQPALQVIVEAGYDRSVDFGEPALAGLIPVLDPVTFSLQFARAVAQGADNAAGLLGINLPFSAEVQDLLTLWTARSAELIGEPYYVLANTVNELFPLALGGGAIDLSGNGLLDPLMEVLGALIGPFTSGE